MKRQKRNKNKKWFGLDFICKKENLKVKHKKIKNKKRLGL